LKIIFNRNGYFGYIAYFLENIHGIIFKSLLKDSIFLINTKELNLDRYISKVISRDHLEKSIIFFKLKDVNLGVNCEDIDTVNFDINKYKFDKNDETIISVVREYINTDCHWKEIPKYVNHNLWHIYGSSNYLLIRDSDTESLPSIMTKSDLWDEDVLWCSHELWKENKQYLDEDDADKLEIEILENHVKRLKNSLWRYTTDADGFRFYTSDRFEIFRAIFSNINYFKCRATESQLYAFNKFFSYN
jgi:hypothetical protein